MAWKRGVKTLYYCRSLSIQRAEAVSGDIAGSSVTMPPHFKNGTDAPSELPLAAMAAQENSNNYEECLACQ
jgi:ribonucleoside-diphosphate reductase alpha chain